MQQIKKLLAGVISASMMFSNMIITKAEETPPGNDHWNYDLVSEDTKDLYADFPLLIDKCMGKDMTMSLDFQYLKNINDGDSVEITVTDLADDSVIKDVDLTSDIGYFDLEDIDNNKNIKVSVSENLGGDINQYDGYINTEFVAVDFPVDITIGETEYNYNNGEDVSQIAVKKVGVQPECNHGEDEECNDNCKTASVLDFYEADELNAEFYNGLDSDSYYELQFDATKNGYTEHYRGFISTYPEGESMGVFTRGYSFSMSAPSTIRRAPSKAKERRTTISKNEFDFSKPYEYNEYRNVREMGFDGRTEIVVKWVVPEDGTYTIETIGTADVMWYDFSVKSNGEIADLGYSRRGGGQGANPSETISILEGQIKYYVLISEDGGTGSMAFRIIRNDAKALNGASAYRDEVMNNYDNGIFSNYVNTENKIRYNGDYNIYAYNVAKGKANLVFTNVKTNLKVQKYSISNRQNGFDMIWEEETGYIYENIEGEQVKTWDFENAIYYIDICQETIPKISDTNYSDSVDGGYNFSFYDPKAKDIYDENIHEKYNDSPVYPVQITEFPYDNSERTIHKGESDWFSFTTGANGGNFTANLYETDGHQQYDITLYESVEIVSTDPPSWNVPEDVGTTTYVEAPDADSKGYWHLTCDDLLPNNTYYIKISRPDSATYSSYYTYRITANIESAEIPTATLSGNVSLSHTIGEDVSIAGLKNSVMANLTCYLNGTAVPAASAAGDVELYYNDAVLTADAVNALSAGTYNITVKYKGIAATGGTVTLTVNPEASADEIVMIENLPSEIARTVTFDWVTAARILANTRLVREGSPQTTLTDNKAVKAVKTSGYNVRGTIDEVVKAANYFYSGGSVDSGDFLDDVVDESTAERTLSSLIRSGNAVVMQLTSISNPEDLSAMRYVVLYGVNLTKHEYMVFDPGDGYTYSVPKDVMHNGGYKGNDDLKFTGQVIEF